ncbi:TPA: hypothetical protein NJ666_004448 [Vibrio parahaemolyticus]|nr:hypothetical protein [Vibrio parahaemolyticus]
MKSQNQQSKISNNQPPSGGFFHQINELYFRKKLMEDLREKFAIAFEDEIDQEIEMIDSCLCGSSKGVVLGVLPFEDKNEFGEYQGELLVECSWCDKPHTIYVVIQD